MSSIKLSGIGVIILAMSHGTTQAQTIIYVDNDAALGGDGTSWGTAYTYLQDALHAADHGDEIRVAGGVYKPDQDEVGNVTPGGREATFQLINGVTIYGGYRGCPAGDCDSGDPDERDIALYQTILSGDLAGNDPPTMSNCCGYDYGSACDDPGCEATVCASYPECCTGSWTNDCRRHARDLCTDVCTYEDNSYHVVDGSGTSPTAILDGFTVTAGIAHGMDWVQALGGGIYITQGSPTLANCTFSGNSADQHGGGMFSADSSPTLTDCMFSQNSAAEHGGGMYNMDDSAPTLTDCTFSGNAAGSRGGGMYNVQSTPTLTNCTFLENSGGSGGGMANWGRSYPSLANCTFQGNTAVIGGGMFNWARASPTLTNCTFLANVARGSGGGGMSNWYDAAPILTDCNFLGNSADLGGGGISNYESTPTLTNCTFSGNVAGTSGGGMRSTHSDPRLTGCTFLGNSADRGGGMSMGSGNYSSNPTLANCTFRGNSAAEEGGGMYNWHGRPTLTNCTFASNVAISGGGMCNRAYGRPTLTNCTFSGNVAAEEGGGMFNSEYSTPRLTNCTFSGNVAGTSGGGMGSYHSDPRLTGSTFSGNSADRGGGMYTYRGNYSSNPTLANCTFSGNAAAEEGGGVFNDRSAPTLTNCILWDDLPDEISGSGFGTVTYSDVQGGYAGVGNIDADPQFVDADGPDDVPGTQDDNLRLSRHSPCIDAGDNGGVTVGTDLDGNPRIVDGDEDGTPTVDMGAYEFQPLMVIASYLDIKPGGCPNPLNPRSQGVASMALVGDGAFDVAEVDIDSLVLLRADGVGEAVTPLAKRGRPRVKIEDVATPFIGDLCDCHEMGSDGIDDLVIKFSTPEMVAAFDLDDLPRGTSIILTLIGTFVDGTAFEASDCIVITGQPGRALNGACLGRRPSKP